MTLRQKLTLWYSGLLAVIIIAFGTLLYGVTRFVLINSVDRTLDATIDEVWQNSSAALFGQFGSPDEFRFQLPEIDVFRASGVVVQVWDATATPDGGDPRLLRGSSNLLNYNQPLDATTLMQHAAVDLSHSDKAPMTLTDTRLNGNHWRVLTRAVDVLGRRVVIQTASSMEAIDQASRDVLIVMLISSVAALLGSMLLGYLISRRAMQPILHLTRAAEQVVTASDLNTRLSWFGPLDEMGKLTAVFNTMMERLQHLFSVQQRFVADVSHELRTPLTAIRGNVEIIRRYGVDDDSLLAIHTEAERMSRLVNDLLMLAKADYGGLQIERHPLELDELVTEVYREAKVLKGERDLTVRIGDYDPVRVNGDGDRLRQLLLNLVSNAIKFTPDGGTITINLRRTSHDAVVEVQDTGIGISEDDQKRVFDRFFQTETSRHRSAGKEGTGLGLSIARWIAQVHGGAITVRSTIGKGTTFTVTIPHLEPRPQGNADSVTRPRIALRSRTSTLPAVVIKPTNPAVTTTSTQLTPAVRVPPAQPAPSSFSVTPPDEH